jgi:hypothetical protein
VTCVADGQAFSYARQIRESAEHLRLLASARCPELPAMHAAPTMSSITVVMQEVPAAAMMMPCAEHKIAPEGG